jgi:hypothetical protein
MTKSRRNQPLPGYFKISGGAVEERDKTRAARQALAREAARRKRRAGRKGRLGEPPAEQHVPERPAGGRATRKVATQKRERVARGARGRAGSGRAARQPSDPPAEPRRASPSGLVLRIGRRAVGMVRLALSAGGHTIALGRDLMTAWRHRHEHLA